MQSYKFSYAKNCIITWLKQWKHINRKTNMWPDLGKSTLFAQNKLQDKQLKFWDIFFNIILHILIKQLLSFLVKFETYNSFLQRDTVVFMPPGRCAQKVGFPRSGHIYSNRTAIEQSSLSLWVTKTKMLHLIMTIFGPNVRDNWPK